VALLTAVHLHTKICVDKSLATMFQKVANFAVPFFNDAFLDQFYILLDKCWNVMFLKIKQ